MISFHLKPMDRRHLPLSSLRAFEAAARVGSFKQAAAELAVTPTAISHQIRALEACVGTPLFERRVRQVALTDAGQALFPVLKNGFDAMEAALDRLAQRVRRPTVTIAATSAFTAKWLVPRLARFQTAHPGIDLQLHASDDVVDMAGSGIDIAIRYGRGPYPGLRAEALFTDAFAPVANPRLDVRRASRLRDVPLIRFPWRRADPLNPTWERWFEHAGWRGPAPSGALRFTDEGHAIQATVACQGVGLLSLALVQEELRAGLLRRCFPGDALPGHTYHLVTRPAEPERPEVSAVLAWLRAEQGAAAD